MSFFIKRLAIVGVGLIGGSLAQSLREQDLVGEIVGLARSRATLETALHMGVIDRAAATMAEAVQGATLVVVATPVCAIVPSVAAMASHLARGAVVTDVGSVKGGVVRECHRLMPEGCHFVGGHPIAGRERAGVAASFPTLFQGSRTILTPLADTFTQAMELVRLVWESTGSKVETMEPTHHDRVLAATSHLPHLMAYSLVNTLSDLEEQLRSEVFRYAAGGFRDFTRIASSDPVMWRDICLENRDAIIEIIDRFMASVDHLKQGIAAGDAAAIQEIFSRSKTTRDRVLEQNKILRGES